MYLSDAVANLACGHFVLFAAMVDLMDLARQISPS